MSKYNSTTERKLDPQHTNNPELIKLSQETITEELEQRYFSQAKTQEGTLQLFGYWWDNISGVFSSGFDFKNWIQVYMRKKAKEIISYNVIFDDPRDPDSVFNDCTTCNDYCNYCRIRMSIWNIHGEFAIYGISQLQSYPYCSVICKQNDDYAVSIGL